MRANQPEGFSIDRITISSTNKNIGFDIPNSPKNGSSWTLIKDNPDTKEIEGFTFDSDGNIVISFSMDRNQTSNFEIEITANSSFSLENVLPENRSTVETPVETNLSFSKNFGVNVKHIENLDNPSEYKFSSFTSTLGEVIESGFVITNNINDNIIKGSKTLVNTIFGSLANDTVTTGVANDTIFGNDGDDIVSAGLGDDVIEGGEGNDTLDYSHFSNQSGIGIDSNLTTGISTGEGTDTFKEFENITGSQSNDILTGDDKVNILKGENASDTLYGNANNDTLEGGKGNDTLEGGTGEDIIKGGTGIDTVSYEHAISTNSDGVTVNLVTNKNIPNIGSSSGIDGVDILYDIENIIASNYNDTLHGSDTNNVIQALDGDD